MRWNTSSRRRSAKPRVSITIDHLGIGTALTTKSLIRQVYNHAPTVHFTVFVMCSDKTRCCSGAMQEAKKIYQLNKKKIRLGIHTLPMEGQFKASSLEQFHNTALLHDGLSQIVGSKYLSLSYHGANAGGNKDKVIPCYLEKYIRYGRTVMENEGDYEDLFMPVISDGASIAHARKIIQRNWEARKVSTFFFHSHQLIGPTQQSQLFYSIISGIKSDKYESFPFPK